MQLHRCAVAVLALAAAATLMPAAAGGQQPTRRRQAPIEIRGQVPTPQVVTVRPRAVPAYSRQVLVPRFFDHDFWPEIQLGYRMVPERQISGRAVTESALAADSATISRGSSAPTDSTRMPPVTPPPPPPRTEPPAAPSDTAVRRPGTAPAR